MSLLSMFGKRIGFGFVKREDGEKLQAPPTNYCLAAAIEAVSSDIVPDDAYYAAGRHFNDAALAGVASPRMAKAQLRDVLGYVKGRTSLKSVSGKRVLNVEEFEEVFAAAKQGGRQVIAFTADDHVVGVLEGGEGGYVLAGDTSLTREIIYQKRGFLIDQYCEIGFVDECDVFDAAVEARDAFLLKAPVLTAEEVAGQLATHRGKDEPGRRFIGRQDRRFDNLLLW